MSAPVIADRRLRVLHEHLVRDLSVHLSEPTLAQIVRLVDWSAWTPIADEPPPEGRPFLGTDGRVVRRCVVVGPAVMILGLGDGASGTLASFPSLKRWREEPEPMEHAPC